MSSFEVREKTMNLRREGATQQLDRLAIAEVMVRERRARDTGLFAEMASYYHPDSAIEVSWFKGSGKDFVEQTEKQALAVKNRSDHADNSGFHGMGATVTHVKNDRAIAEADCTLHNFFLLDGIACKYTGYVRLPWRFLRVDDTWKIAGARCVYLHDLITPCNPSAIPVLNQTELSAYRASYRYLSYHLVRAGLKPQDDLPGEDLPETVTHLKNAEWEWLEQG